MAVTLGERGGGFRLGPFLFPFISAMPETGPLSYYFVFDFCLAVLLLDPVLGNGGGSPRYPLVISFPSAFVPSFFMFRLLQLPLVPSSPPVCRGHSLLKLTRTGRRGFRELFFPRSRVVEDGVHGAALCRGAAVSALLSCFLLEGISFRCSRFEGPADFRLLKSARDPGFITRVACIIRAPAVDPVLPSVTLLYEALAVGALALRYPSCSSPVMFPGQAIVVLDSRQSILFVLCLRVDVFVPALLYIRVWPNVSPSLPCYVAYVYGPIVELMNA